MRSKEELKAECFAIDVDEFFSQTRPLLVKQGISFLIPSLCGKVSVLLSIKTKNRNRLNVTDDILLAFTVT